VGHASVILLTIDSLLPNESFPALVITIPFLLGAVGIFAYANLVYTPEIMQGASLLRQENREREVRKLISAVKCHSQNDQAFSDIRGPLETALGTSLEDYVQAVNDRTLSNDIDDETCTSASPFGKADQELASVIKSELGNGS
jgi:hypothetical protein